MEDFANRLKDMNLSAISGVIEGIVCAIEPTSENIKHLDKLKYVAEELFNRELDSQESYLAMDHEMCNRMLGRTSID